MAKDNNFALSVNCFNSVVSSLKVDMVESALQKILCDSHITSFHLRYEVRKFDHFLRKGCQCIPKISKSSCIINIYGLPPGHENKIKYPRSEGEEKNARKYREHEFDEQKHNYQFSSICIIVYPIFRIVQ